MMRRRMKMSVWIAAFAATVVLSGCTAQAAGAETNVRADAGTPETAAEQASEEITKEFTAMKMKVQIGEAVFTATLEENTAVRELTGLLQKGPVTIEMNDYAGFEKVGPLGTSLTANDSQTTTAPGDIVLYLGNQIVMFYGTNSWSYTRIGHIDDRTGWEEALGKGGVTAAFSRMTGMPSVCGESPQGT